MADQKKFMPAPLRGTRELEREVGELPAGTVKCLLTDYITAFNALYAGKSPQGSFAHILHRNRLQGLLETAGDSPIWAELIAYTATLQTLAAKVAL